jgi:1,6-anhydro-N-acetylmuramate kinase
VNVGELIRQRVHHMAEQLIVAAVRHNGIPVDADEARSLASIAYITAEEVAKEAQRFEDSFEEKR